MSRSARPIPGADGARSREAKAAPTDKARGSLEIDGSVEVDIYAPAVGGKFYTEDKELTQLADGFLPVQKMPVQLQATSLATLDAARPPPAQDAPEQPPISETAKHAAPEAGDADTR